MKDILQELKEIVGDRVSASPSERCCYASDASQVIGLPDFVVRPENTDQVSRLLRLCSERLIPATARGAGTGLAGGCSPIRGGHSPGHVRHEQDLGNGYRESADYS